MPKNWGRKLQLVHNIRPYRPCCFFLQCMFLTLFTLRNIPVRYTLSHDRCAVCLCVRLFCVL